jgi:hypothetical protein
VRNVIKIIRWFRKFITPNDAITILDEKGNILSYNNKLKYVPRAGELLYLDDGTILYKVMRVAHRITKPRTIWIYVSIEP